MVALLKLIRFEAGFAIGRFRREGATRIAVVYETTVIGLLSAGMAFLGHFLGARIEPPEAMAKILCASFAVQALGGLIARPSDVERCRFYHGFSFGWSTIGAWFVLKNLWFGFLPVLASWFGGLVLGRFAAFGGAVPVVPFVSLLAISWIVNYLSRLSSLIRGKGGAGVFIGMVLGIVSFLLWGKAALRGDPTVAWSLFASFLLAQSVVWKGAVKSFKNPGKGAFRGNLHGLSGHPARFFRVKDVSMFLRCKMPRDMAIGFLILSAFFSLAISGLALVRLFNVELPRKLDWDRFISFGPLWAVLFPGIQFVALSTAHFAFHHRFFPTLLSGPGLLSTAYSSAFDFAAAAAACLGILLLPTFVLWGWSLGALASVIAFLAFMVPFLSSYCFILSPFKMGLEKANAWRKPNMAGLFGVNAAILAYSACMVRVSVLVGETFSLVWAVLQTALFLALRKPMIETLERVTRKNKDKLLSALRGE